MPNRGASTKGWLPEFRLQPATCKHTDRL